MTAANNVNWNNFRAALTPQPYNKLRVLANGIPMDSCTNPTIVQDIALKMRTLPSPLTPTTSWVDGGNTWYVGECGSGMEFGLIHSGAPTPCACAVAKVIRSGCTSCGTNWGGWGGPASTCPGQNPITFRVEFWYGLPCTDTPKTTIKGPVRVCPNRAFSLEPQNFYAFATYQWQYSKDGVNWSNFIGGVDPYTGGIRDSITVPTWYRLKISCDANTFKYTTPVKAVSIADFYYCYCLSAAKATSGIDVGQFKVVKLPDGDTLLNNGVLTPPNPAPIVSNNKADKIYTSFMDSVAPVVFYRDSNYIFVVNQINSTNALQVSTAGVFLDWNRDGFYDTLTERVVHKQTDLSGRTSDTFKIPATAQIGLTGLRVVLSGTYPAEPCGDYGAGETEDYLAEIRWEPCSGPANPGVVEADTSVCVGYDYLVTDTTYEKRKSGFTRLWQLSGDNQQWFNVPSGFSKDTLERVFNGQPLYYRLRTVCEPTKDTSYTEPLHVNLKAGYKCYCFSQAIGGRSRDTSDIGAFSLAAVSHTDGGTHLLNAKAIQKRSDYTDNTPIDMDVDSIYTLTVFHTMRSSIHGDAKITVFMDFNNNTVYDIPEDLVYTGYTAIGNFTLIDNVKVKATAIRDKPTGLRVILNNNIAPNDQSDKACGVYTSGETEDYMIIFREKGYTGIGGAKDAQQMSIYPNPTSGKFTVDFPNKTQAKNLQLTVTNVTGQKVLQNSYAVNGKPLTQEVDIAQQAKGVYFVEINADGVKMMQKLVFK
jgi:hypothetical protein